MLGRICLSGKLAEVSPEVYKIVKRGVQFYDGLKEIIRDGETTLIDTDEIKSLRHPEGVIRLARRSADGEAVACYAMAYGGGNRTAQFEVEGFEIVSYYGNAACGLQNGRFCVELGEKPLSACVAVLRKKRA